MTNDKLKEPTVDYNYSLTPSSFSKPKRKNHPTESLSPLPVEASLDNRTVRRRLTNETEVESVRRNAGLSSDINFTVYLPNKTSVDVQIDRETCQWLDVVTFLDMLRKEQSTAKPDATGKEKKRQIQWGPHVYIEDFEGNSIADGGFLPLNSRSPGILLLQDGHPDSVHSHPGFWNVTPEPQMLGVLPQDYTLFSALADELDNSLQAVSRLTNGKPRLISVDLDHKNGKITIFDTGRGMDSTLENSIARWGTIGSSNSRHSVSEAVGGEPPYLKPNFGMYGFGGIGAGLHLGGNITVSSKTEKARRVAVLQLEKEALQNDVKSGSVWKTAGAFRAPTEDELRLSPHGSFTKVEITNLHRKVSAWKVDEVRRKLKDYYFPYIQNDEGGGSGRTARPVVIQVNSMDLAEVLGGEVAITHSLSSVGEPYVLLLEFTHQAERAELGRSKQDAGLGRSKQDAELGRSKQDAEPGRSKHDAEPGRSKPDKAHARITCFYFPIRKGKEAIEEVLEKLKQEDTEFGEESFETFSRQSIRRLGRLLPDARGKGLPFMEPKKGSKSKEANKQQFKRVKAFIDLDAGFVPTTSKMDLLSKHHFTEALFSLGLALDSAKSPKGRRGGGVSVVIKRGTKMLAADRLHADYVKWVTDSHERFDENATFDDNTSIIFFSTPDNKKDLGITSEVFRVLYTLKCRNISWKVNGSEPVPIRLKFLKGFPGLNNDNQLFFTVECFISEGMADSPGETKIICRPLGVLPEQGSKATEGEEPSFTLGKSSAFALDVLFCDKYEKIDEVAWEKQEEKIRNKSPGFVELLNEHEVLKFDVEGTLANNLTLQAGSKLPKELIAVVRPKNFKQSSAESTSSSKCTPIPRIEQRFIIQDPMELRLTVKHMESRHSSSNISGEDVEKAKEVYIAATKPLLRNNVKGLYSFGADNTLVNLMTKMGIYLFTFEVVSEAYRNVAPTSIRITVLASDAVRWKLCTHEGSCARFHKSSILPLVKASSFTPSSGEVNSFQDLACGRLGEVLDTSLWLTQFDKFDNAVVFSSIPREIYTELSSLDGYPTEISTTMSKEAQLSEDCFSLQLPRIELSGGCIAPLLPSYHAFLRILISKKYVAGFEVKVVPGGVASTALKENEAPDKWLRPGQIIENIVFQVFDKYGNLVEKGEEVKLVLEGLLVTDGKHGAIRKVDENGCVDLCGRLKVTAPYGNTASIVLQSTDGRCLGETPFDIVSRTMRVQNEQRSIPVGSQLKGIMVVIVDEYGEMDEEVDGPSYTLTLEWDRNITVPFRCGKCTLPVIDLPHTLGLWTRKVELTQSPDLHTRISVELIEAEVQTMVEDTYAYLKSTKTLKSLVPYEPDDLVPSDPNASPKCLVPFQPADLVPSEFGNNSDSMTTLLNASIDRITRLQNKAQRQGRKAKIIEDQIAQAKKAQASTEHSMSHYQGQLKLLESSLKLKDSVKNDGNPWQGEQAVEYTSKEVLADIRKLGDPPGTHAANLLFTAATEDRDYKAGPGKDIIGVVATLASVETSSLSKTLAQFLGLERMLSIVCKRKGAEDFLESYNEAGEVDDSKGLHGFAKRLDLRISGHFRAIVLNEASFYKGLDGMPAVNNDHPQKLLNITSAAEKGLQDPGGFLGYAVNLLHLNDFQLKTQVSGRYGLRESLFFQLFSFLQVYDTRRNMMCATAYVRTGAVSLDGGIIQDKDHLEFRFGWSDPIVQFAVEPQATPSSQSRNLQSLRMQRSEIKQKIESLHQQSVNELPRLEEKFRKARNKVNTVTREVEEEAKHGQALAQAVHALGNNIKSEHT